MKIGTFSCWLWGHKFIGWYSTSEKGEEQKGAVYLRTSDFCVRCGIDKESLTH